MSLSYTRVRVECPAIPEGAEVREVTGREAISELFDVEVVVVCGEGASIDVGEVVSAPVTIVFEQRDASGGGPHFVERRRIHGAVYQCDDLLQPDDRHATYALRIGPRVWLTRLVETLDVLLGMSVPEILRSKLGQVELVEGEDFVLRLNEPDYEAREMVVQYKETDLAFLSRLCEHVGVGFTFEHDDGRDVLVFCDDNAVYPEIAEGGAVRFAARGERAGVFELRESTRIVPRHFVQRDYNYRSPQVDLTGSAEMPDGFGGGVVEYGGHFKTPAEGEWLATIRSQEQRCRRRRFTGVGSDARLAAGRRVRVEGHPRGDVELLITDVTYAIRQSTMMGGDGGERAYEVKFGAVSATNTFRPQRVTPRPRVGGVLNGIVEGEGEGKYAHIDEHGRYRVRFLFDTSGKGEAKASHCVRMMQPSSGAGYGVHFPLRPGTEVLIAFVDGDPDRPIIAGTVPNAETASPVNATNAPKNVIRTGGGNAIDIDDTEDGQRVKLSSPRFNSVVQLGEPNDMASGLGFFTDASVLTMGTTSISSMTTYASSWSNFNSSWGNHVSSFAGAMTPLMRMEAYQGQIDSQLEFAAAAVQIGVSAREIPLQKATIARENKESELQALGATLDGFGKDLDEKCSPSPHDGVSERTAKETALAARDAYGALQEELAAAIEQRNGIAEAYTAALATGDDAKAATLKEGVDAADAEIRRLDEDVQRSRTDLSVALLDLDSTDAMLGDYALALTAYETKRLDLLTSRRAEWRTQKNLASDENYKRAKTAVDEMSKAADYSSMVSAPLWELVSLKLSASLDTYTRAVVDAMIDDVVGQRTGEGNKVKVASPDDIAQAKDALLAWKNFMIKTPAPHVEPMLGVTTRSASTPWDEMAEKSRFKAKPAGGTAMKVKAALALAIPVLGPYVAQRMLSDDADFKDARNVVGSEGKTVVFGKESVFVHGTEFTTVSSSDTMLLSADKQAILHARDTVEVAGGTATKLTSHGSVDVVSRGEVRLSTTDASADCTSWCDASGVKDKTICVLEMMSGTASTPGPKIGTVTLGTNIHDGATAATRLTMSNDDGDGNPGVLSVLVGDPSATFVTLDAKAGTAKLEAKASDQVSKLSLNGDVSGMATLEASQSISLTAAPKDAGPQLVLDVDAGVSIECGDGTVEMTTDGITIAFKDASIHMEAGKLTLAIGSTSLELNGTSLKIVAEKFMEG